MAVCVVGVLATPNLMAGFEVTMGTTSGGSPYTVTPTGGTLFETFCLERNEYFNPGGKYSATLNTGAVNGGYSGGNPDIISIGTAAIYASFRANGNSIPGAAPAVIQNAIWTLEGEFTTAPLLPTDAQAVTDFFNAHTTWNNANPYTSSLSMVRVLNLTDGNNAPCQDMLTVVPEPTTMIAGLFLGIPFAFSGLRMLRKS